MINEEVQYEKTLSLNDTPKLVHRSTKRLCHFSKVQAILPCQNQEQAVVILQTDTFLSVFFSSSTKHYLRNY